MALAFAKSEKYMYRKCIHSNSDEKLCPYHRVWSLSEHESSTYFQRIHYTIASNVWQPGAGASIMDLPFFCLPATITIIWGWENITTLWCRGRRLKVKMMTTTIFTKRDSANVSRHRRNDDVERHLWKTLFLIEQCIFVPPFSVIPPFIILWWNYLFLKNKCCFNFMFVIFCEILMNVLLYTEAEWGSVVINWFLSVSQNLKSLFYAQN